MSLALAHLTVPKDGEDDKGGNDGAATFSGVPAVVAGVVGIAIAALI